MAISRERLQELIEEGATIYSKSGHPYVLKDSYAIMDNTLYQIIGQNREISTSPVDKLDELFEPEKQAEWHLKYHATRTEELDLPTWEEFVCETFVSREGWLYTLLKSQKNKIYLWLGHNMEKLVEEWDATEENYIKACDLCLKLFKGEEDE